MLSSKPVSSRAGVQPGVLGAGGDAEDRLPAQQAQHSLFPAPGPQQQAGEDEQGYGAVQCPSRLEQKETGLEKSHWPQTPQGPHRMQGWRAAPCTQAAVKDKAELKWMPWPCGRGCGLTRAVRLPGALGTLSCLINHTAIKIWCFISVGMSLTGRAERQTLLVFLEPHPLTMTTAMGGLSLLLNPSELRSAVAPAEKQGVSGSSSVGRKLFNKEMSHLSHSNCSLRNRDQGKSFSPE